MTLAELAQFVCSKVNQLDAVSQGLCRDYINARYQMIYRVDNWRDAMQQVTVSTPIGEQVLDLPAVLERVATVRVSGGEILESVTSQFILETHPELLQVNGGSGTPIYYEETGARSINLFPAPDKAYFLNFWGKSVFVPLEDDDEPIIRNIENCLLAYAEHDMLDRARSRGSAKLKLEEADALLEAMRKTERDLSNLPRRSKNVTVNGDSLAELVDAVSCRVGDYSAPSQIMIREYLRRNYVDLYDSEMWLESLVMARVIRDGSEVILPEYFNRVLAIRSNSELAALVPADQSLYFGVAPQVFEQSGSPVDFSILTPCAVATLPIGNEQMKFSSASAADIGTRVLIRGETGGVEVTEQITLNGTNDVFTYHTYDMPLTISKQLTVGYVTVKGRISDVLLVQLSPRHLEKKHIRLWLVPFPDDTIDGTECLVLGKRRIEPFITDEDTPLLRGIANVLINQTASDYFTQAGNDKGAAASAAKAKGSLQVMIGREAKQTANQPRIVPFVDTPFGAGCSFGGDW